MTTVINTSSHYQTQSDDTTIAEEIVLFNLWRSQTITERVTHLNRRK